MFIDNTKEHYCFVPEDAWKPLFVNQTRIVNLIRNLNLPINFKITAKESVRTGCVFNNDVNGLIS